MNFGHVLVTGGAGFLGSQLVKKLLPLSDSIYIIDDLSTGNISSVPKDPKITFYHESITNEDILNKVLPNVDYIFHLACKNLVLSYNNVKEDFDTNLYGGWLLLQKSQELSPKLKRFIYTSTASVYGDASLLPTPETYYNIKLPYSASKFSTEHYCQVYHHMYQLPTTILRLSNVYGPGQLISNPYCGVVAKFFEEAANDAPLTIYDDGKQTRDFTYVDDALDAILLAACNDQTIGLVFNVSTKKETSILELAENITTITGLTNVRLNFQPKRSVDIVQRRCLDNTLLKSYGWNCQNDLVTGLTKTFAWLNRGETP
ncbi:NAD-dependent epimerase/dehydratase family protein [Heyndrickxia oleronia]|uniref:NAD-dependent epimerase/dehydratase family protein n=1 Tax=Heyndrickxia oleronia TaxID=38875 RepID=UPI00203BCBEE|nr:NAD-dependent epimerase/dehydratase family protein [Heyndrickxia oleronia]MCM3237997.1 NAD-dependent epimerase/dehydratase family protein [Heyndrickxia oleronia]